MHASPQKPLKLRTAMAELDQRLRTLRHETEALREQRAALTARAAKLASDIEHIDATCLNDLGVEAITLREDQTIARIEGDALHTEEEEARALKQRLEAMGPVNMMALEEYNETVTRHSFLETQRKDLLDSIENTQASIKEIDDVSRMKFDEAFKVINENFSVTFTKLFGGGQAFMKLTDAENSNESGIDIVASPPGKKLQNILLLSGGEKALTALSLLVGIFQFQPAPFCILDEVDAPLDETNVGRFAKLIHDMSAINAVRRHHSQQTHHGPGRCHLRRHHAGTRRLEDRQRQPQPPRLHRQSPRRAYTCHESTSFCAAGAINTRSSIFSRT